MYEILVERKVEGPYYEHIHKPCLKSPAISIFISHVWRGSCTECLEILPGAGDSINFTSPVNWFSQSIYNTTQINLVTDIWATLPSEATSSIIWAPKKNRLHAEKHREATRACNQLYRSTKGMLVMWGIFLVILKNDSTCKFCISSAFWTRTQDEEENNPIQSHCL